MVDCKINFAIPVGNTNARGIDLFQNYPDVQLNRKTTPIIATILGGALAAVTSAVVVGPALAALANNRRKSDVVGHKMRKSVIKDVPRGLESLPAHLQTRPFRSRRPFKSMIGKFIGRFF